MKNMVNYFQDQKSMYEFALLFLDGESRCNVLGITAALFTSKKKAASWYNNILGIIEEPKAIKKLNEIYAQF